MSVLTKDAKQLLLRIDNRTQMPGDAEYAASLIRELAEDMRTLIRLLANKPDWRGAPFIMNDASHRALEALERSGG